jgi:predicted Zn finger-like uncharacterized protein
MSGENDKSVKCPSCGSSVFRVEANQSGLTRMKCLDCGKEWKPKPKPATKNKTNEPHSISLTKNPSLLIALSAMASFFIGTCLYLASNPSLRALVYYPFPSLQNSWPPAGGIRTTFVVIAIILMLIGLAGIVYGIITLHKAITNNQKK